MQYTTLIVLGSYSLLRSVLLAKRFSDSFTFPFLAFICLLGLDALRATDPRLCGDLGTDVCEFTERPAVRMIEFGGGSR